MAEDTKRTIIETGTEIDGVIKSERPIVLSGSVKGQVTAPSLDVTPEGTVTGTIKVSRFSCKGVVGGEIDAETVELSGRVCDETKIRSKSLEVKIAQGEGAVEVTFGNCDLHVGELSAKTKAKPVAVASESTKLVEASQHVDSDVVDAVSALMK